ncbi:regulatory protein GemA [Bradyrhizobium quebecense]|uniref:Regulatory protein GemA n=1 Tax=Bradyrhizobium quebecense TaxID=2748629 RepID=A0A973WPN0_9BRAD|nr:regulatory protein GemA [Bradyrhizobium quebecense]UGA45987.1 regulatory protein GemA [Bradyrhizobium quebecense]
MRPSSQPATTSMIAAIHALKRNAGLGDDDTYRDFLRREAGVVSAKDLSVRDAQRVIEKLRDLAGTGTALGQVAGLDGPIGAKLRALWISGYNLGIVRDRSDKAMLSYLQRQTGVSHVRFLNDPRAGSSAIEGLKSWLARDGGVEWPDGSVGRDDVIARKRAVLDAQWRRLIEIGDVKPIGGAVNPMEDLLHYAGRVTRQNQWSTFESHHYDDVQQGLGRKLRAALDRRGAEA